MSPPSKNPHIEKMRGVKSNIKEAICQYLLKILQKSYKK